MEQSYRKRLLSDPKRVVFLVLLLLLPSFEILQLFYQYSFISSYPNYNWMAFLSGKGRGHIFQILYFWFLPVYTILLFGEFILTDYKCGMHSIFYTKIGKRSYVNIHLLYSFTYSFFVMLSGLLINYLLCKILFSATPWTIQIGFYNDVILDNLYNYHPTLSYIVFMIIVSLFAGLAGVLGSAFCLLLKERKYAYPATFFVWFALVSRYDSLMCVFQPYTEFTFTTITKIMIEDIVVLLCVTGIIYWYEVKYDEI